MNTSAAVMLANLTPAQRTALQGLLARFAERPSFSDYEKAGKALAALPAPRPKSIKSIPGAEPGVHGMERWSSPLFKPRSTKPADLPEGLALVSIYDSGGNHALVNAAAAVWTRLWNYWDGPVAANLRANLALWHEPSNHQTGVRQMSTSAHAVKPEEFGGKASYTFITGDSECVVHNASGEADARKKLKETLQHAEFDKKQARRWTKEAKLKAVTYV